jgi:NAD(P)-dependent dehydrogenase (short-subunit alcohol dehydrogenase family)
MPVVVVTGASHGIGRAIAEAFANERDAKLALVSRDEEKLEAVAEACANRGADTVVLPTDVTDDEAVAEMAKTVCRAWGPPDVLVNNAGLFRPGLIVETTPEVFRKQIDVNLVSAFSVTRAFLARMIERKKGHIFFSASVASIKGYPGGVGYCAGKHGLLGFARVVREETKEQGIRVTSLILGATLTPSWEGTDFPDDRFMPVEDVAEAAISAYRMTGRSVVEEILIRPQLGDI